MKNIFPVTKLSLLLGIIYILIFTYLFLQNIGCGGEFCGMPVYLATLPSSMLIFIFGPIFMILTPESLSEVLGYFLFIIVFVINLSLLVIIGNWISNITLQTSEEAKEIKKRLLIAFLILLSVAGIYYIFHQMKDRFENRAKYIDIDPSEIVTPDRDKVFNEEKTYLIEKDGVPEHMDSNNSESTTEIISPKQSMVVNPKTAKVGDKFGNFIVTNINLYNLTGEDSIDISFSGSGVISGTIYPAEMLGPGIIFDEISQNVFPAILLNGELRNATRADILGPLVKTLPKEAISYMGGTNPTYAITAELKDYRFRYEPKESGPTAILVDIKELVKE